MNPKYFKNRFKATPPSGIAKDTNFMNLDDGEIYKWDGRRWIKASQFKGRTHELEPSDICHHACVSLQVIRNPILKIWCTMPVDVHKFQLCPICNERLLKEDAVFVTKIEYDYSKLEDNFYTGDQDASDKENSTI